MNEIYALSTMLLLQMTGLFQFTVRMAIDTEARFTSVERLAQYEKVQPLMLINNEMLWLSAMALHNHEYLIEFYVL